MISPAGLRQHKVTLISLSRARDTYGQSTVTTATVADFYVSIQPLRGQERILSMQVQPEATHKLRMVYDSRVSAESRLAFGSRTFEVMGPPINVDERGRELELTCKELA